MLWLLGAVAAAAVAGTPDGGGLCGTAASCFYNGACVAQACVCSGAWTGAFCNVLAELDSVQLWPNPSLPLPTNASLITDSWGVTVGRDPATGAWALYACTACLFAGGQPTPFSMHSSGVVAATGPSLEGPFTYTGEFLGVFSEGPHMVPGPGGEAAWLLITPGNNASRSPVTCRGD